MKSAEGMFDESVVFVTKQGTKLRSREGRIVVTDSKADDDPTITGYPTEKVTTVNVFGDVNFTTPFIRTANEQGITLNYFTQNGKYRGSFVPEKNTIAEIRRAQYALATEEEIAIAQQII